MAIVAPVLGFTPKSHTHSLTLNNIQKESYKYRQTQNSMTYIYITCTPVVVFTFTVKQWLRLSLQATSTTLLP